MLVSYVMIKKSKVVVSLLCVTQLYESLFAFSLLMYDLAELKEYDFLTSSQTRKMFSIVFGQQPRIYSAKIMFFAWSGTAKARV